MTPKQRDAKELVDRVLDSGDYRGVEFGSSTTEILAAFVIEVERLRAEVDEARATAKSQRPVKEKAWWER